jgi:hypothetical protein
LPAAREWVNAMLFGGQHEAIITRIEEQDAEIARLRSPREFLERWKNSFGGGMVPFDTAYFAKLREGASHVDATKAGAYALLDEFVLRFERGD